MKPSSFCSMATESCWEELYGLLLSLSLFHPNEKVFLIVDTETKNKIEKVTPKLKLDITWNVALDKYTGLDRNKMNKISPTMFTEFVMNKCEIMKMALKHVPDTLFLDSDMVILDEINDIDNSKMLGVSPHYIRQPDCILYGYYNAGLLWTKSEEVINDWVLFTKTSRFHEQGSIEDIVNKYSNFKFGENYNFSWWRVFQSDEDPKKIVSYLGSNAQSQLTYKGLPLKIIHTHFKNEINKEANVVNFNNMMLQAFIQLQQKYYKQLLVIYKIVNVNWIIKINSELIDKNLEKYTNIFKDKDVMVYKEDNPMQDELLIFNVIAINNFDKLTEDIYGNKTWETAIEKLFYD